VFVHTFEIVQEGHASTVVQVLTLPHEGAIWCQTEALALRIQNRDRPFILVKNSKGETVVRAGVTTTLASIEACSCGDCPIKRELEQRVLAGRHTAPGFGLQMQCPLSAMDTDKTSNRLKPHATRAHIALQSPPSILI